MVAGYQADTAPPRLFFAWLTIKGGNLMLLNNTVSQFRKSIFPYFHAFCLILLFTFYLSVNGYSETRLDTDTQGAAKSWWPKVSSDNTGHVYVVWKDGRDGSWDIYFNYSSDYGATWQANDIRLDTGDAPGANTSREPVISCDNAGHVYVTWDDNRNGSPDIYFNYSSDYGATWQASGTRLDSGDTAGASWSIEPEMSSDGSGHVYVTWEDYRNGLWDIYFNYSCDYGATWKASGIRLDTGGTPGASHSRWPELSSDDSGHVYVTWGDDQNGSAVWDIYFNYSSDYGVTWQASGIRLDTGDTAGAGKSLYPNIGSDNSGYVYVTWEDYRNGSPDVYFNYSSDYGATWQESDTRLDTGDTAGASWSIEPEMSSDGSGNVYVTWGDYRNGTVRDVYFNYSSDYGATWQASDIRLDIGDTTGASDSVSPNIGSDDGGNVYVTWHDLRNGKRDIYFNYSSDYGVTWQVSDTKLDIGDTQGVSDSWYPEISNDNSGHIYVTWRDQRDGEPDIYFDTLSTPTTNTNVVAIEGGLNDITPPSIPASLTATAVSQSEINLSWDASTDDKCVTGYNIYRDGVGTPIATTTGTTYQDTGLSPATFYTYNVSAIDHVPNESSQSLPASDTTDAPETTPPSTPANLTATAVSPYQIDLSWDASTDDIGVTAYNIYKDGGVTPIATTAGTTYQDTGLSPATFNTYNVSAIDFSGNESAQSSQVSDITFTPDGTSLSTPANLTAPDDTTALTATAQMVSLSLKMKKGCFRVDFTATDNCDANPDLVATLNGYPVTNGQIVELKRKKKFKVKIKGEGSSDDDESKSHDGDSRGRKGGRGHRCAADVRFEGPSFTLNVTATDACGNVDIVSVNHAFEDGSSDDDGSGHKKKKK